MNEAAVFILGLLPVLLLAILWHEAGHVVAARLADLPVLAWGIGVRKPWFHWRLGNTVIYLALPVTIGLTLVRLKKFDGPPRPYFWMIFGGPAASVIGLALGGGMWWWGWHSPLLVHWLMWSGLIVLGSAIPRTFHSGSMTIPNDAARMVEITRFGRALPMRSIGSLFETEATVRDLFLAIESHEGRLLSQASVAIAQTLLGDFRGAHANLAEIEALSPSDAARRRMTYAQAVLAVEQDADDVPECLERAKSLLGDDQYVMFTLDALLLHWQVKRGKAGLAEVAKLQERAAEAKRDDWSYAADSLAFEIDPGVNADERCHELVNRHRRYASELVKAGWFSIAACKLHAQGLTERATLMVAAAEEAIAAEARVIKHTETRAALLDRAAEALAPCVTAPRQQLDEALNRATTAAKRQVNTVAKMGLTWATVGLLVIAGAVVCSRLDLITEREIIMGVAMMWGMVVFAGGAMLVSLLKGEKAWRLWVAALLLIVASFAVLALTRAEAPAESDGLSANFE